MIPVGTKVYFSVTPADLRRSFDGLAALALGVLERNPAEGGLFVFLNKKANQIRILFRDPHGWCIVGKRLDRGHFRRPRVKDGAICWEIDASMLMMFLDDIDLSRASRKRRSSSARHLELVQPQLLK